MLERLGDVLDISEATKENFKPGDKPKMKVYPPPQEGVKGPLGISAKDQATSPQRVEVTKG